MNYLKWVGTITSIIGAFLVAFALPSIGYLFFIIGAACWLAVGVITKDKALFTLNAVFFCANCVGVYNFVL